MALDPRPNLDAGKPTSTTQPVAVSPPNPTTTNANDADTFGATTPPPAEQTPPKQPKAASTDETGTVRVTLERDYWPKKQPKQDPGDRVHRETRYRAGETHSIPVDEAMDLIEAGAAKRAKG